MMTFSNSEYDEILEKLKMLPLITETEEKFQFLKDIEEITSEAQEIISGKQKLFLSDLDSLIERFSNAHSRDVSTPHPPSL